jgi:hypothetical protein
VSGVTADRYFYKDMIQVGAALARFHASMWRTVPVVEQVAEARREASASPPITGGIGWGLHKSHSAEILYQAVVGSRLALFAWPTRNDDQGSREPADEVQVLRQLPPALVEQLRPLHRGLPSNLIGGRQPILKHYPGLSANDVPVFVSSEFERWFDGERGNGAWATQRPRDAADNRARMPRRPGRPSILREVERTIAAIVADNQWTKAEPISRLGGIVRTRGIQANDDTVRKSLDGLYVQTGDSRYCSRFFERRNPWTFQR